MSLKAKIWISFFIILAIFIVRWCIVRGAISVLVSLSFFIAAMTALVLLMRYLAIKEGLRMEEICENFAQKRGYNYKRLYRYDSLRKWDFYGNREKIVDTDRLYTVSFKENKDKFIISWEEERLRSGNQTIDPIEYTACLVEGVFRFPCEIQINDSSAGAYFAVIEFSHGTLSKVKGLSKEFTEWFEVYSDNEEFAYQLLDKGLREILMEIRKIRNWDVHFEAKENRFALIVNRIEKEEDIDYLVDKAKSIRNLVKVILAQN